MSSNTPTPTFHSPRTSIEIKPFGSPAPQRRSLSLHATTPLDTPPESAYLRRLSPADAHFPLSTLTTFLQTARAQVAPSTGEQVEARLLEEVAARASLDAAALPDSQLGGFSQLAVILPDGSKTRIEVPRNMLVSELLRFIVYRRHLKFDEYVARLPPTEPGQSVHEMPIVPMTALVAELGQQVVIGPKEVRIARGGDEHVAMPSKTLYVTEGGVEVLVMEMVNGKALVTAGTIEKLLERLADENEQDMRYVQCILLCYRFSMESLRLFEQLYLRFHIRAPQNATVQEAKYFEKYQISIQEKYAKKGKGEKK